MAHENHRKAKNTRTPGGKNLLVSSVLVRRRQRPLHPGAGVARRSRRVRRPGCRAAARAARSSLAGPVPGGGGMRVRCHPLFQRREGLGSFDLALATRLQWRRRRALRAAYAHLSGGWRSTAHAARVYDVLQCTAHRLLYREVNWVCECRACRFTELGGPSDRVADGLGARERLFRAPPNVVAWNPDTMYRSSLRNRARRLAQSSVRRPHVLALTA